MTPAALILAALATQAPESSEAFLRTEMQFDREALVRLKTGAPEVRQLRTADPTELAFFGVVRVHVTQEEFRDRLRAIEPFLRVDGVRQLGRFGSPPSLDDVAALDPPRGDLESLRHCRPGACDVKLTHDAIEAAAALDPQAPDFEPRAASLLRAEVVGQLASYLENGDAALAVYHDKPLPVSLAAGLRYLLRETPHLREFVPELPRLIAESPDSSTVERRYFWEVAETGSKPVTMVQELLIIPRTPESRPGTLALLRQLYATHYLDGELAALGLFDPSEEESSAGAWLFYMDRSLFDAKLGGLKKGVLESRARRTFQGRLRWFKRILEGRGPGEE